MAKKQKINYEKFQNGKPKKAKLLITPQDITPTLPSFRVRGVLNPGGLRLENGKILLMARIAETPKHGETYFLAPRFTGEKETRITIESILRKKGVMSEDAFMMKENISRLPTISHLRKIILDKSGTGVEHISEQPDFAGLKDDGDFGIEDARITQLKSEGRYAMTYVSVSMTSGVSTSLAISKNLTNWQRKGIIFRQQNKDVVIFPEKIKGHYVALNRPEGTMIFDKPRIWISYSKDLQYWGKDKAVLSPRNSAWDHLRIGAGPTPLKTNEGWLCLYHGVHLKDRKDEDSQKIYNAGAFLLDLKDPAKVLARSPTNTPLFRPEYEFEKKGFLGGVVFPSAAIPDLDGKNLLVYSGAADSIIEVRKMKISEILNSLE